ncbi:heterokaryon incompatibility protein-domain-containing protein [Dactylonectria macrodidyma]|uniref:Heterokaryon incompatibility protein-domain-containing protein n=1 Tax=Dactylonectria macrodidyma TaxID=307937 RepID=A0A9P9DSV0_9HYPO|nr:heterokaryon incompatibility protein-domain-containing protein [Dactylonectria macrodidyma]
METPSINLDSSGKTSQNCGLFSYKKLKSPKSQIRLLTLHPSNEYARPIDCSIQDADIDKPTPYKALSYCWGKGDKSHSVSIDKAALDITESLDSAMRHMRHQNEPIIVWIDQICINQSDDNEKNDQVEMMTRIYSKAEQVLVWLGPADQGSDDAMDLYAEVGDTICKTGLQYYCNRDMFSLVDAAVHRKDPGDQLWQKVSEVQSLTRELLLPCLQAMVDWDRRYWFTRVWVVQEFCVGVDPWFICGHKRIPVDYVKTTRLFLGIGETPEFLAAVRKLGEDKLPLLQALNNQDPTPAFFSARTWRQKYDRGESPGDTLLELLRKTYVSRGANATEKKDRIFSLLGISNDADRLGIHIDYKRTEAQVLTDAAKVMIEKGNLAVLSYVQFPRDVGGLPSWAPDWRSNLRPSFYPYQEVSLEDEHYFKPSGDRSPAVLPGFDNTAIGLGGFVVDTVEDVGSIWKDDSSAKDPLRHQSFLCQIRFLCRLSAAKNQPIYASRQRRDEAEWRVPIADIWEANEPGSGARQRATGRAMKALAEFRHQLAWFECVGLVRSAVAPDNREPSMYRLSMSKMSGMRPFVTYWGYVGIGSPGMCPGDVLVILFGARVCSILRPTGMGANMAKRYVYIGEAYCDGVMDGELLGRRWEEVFYLV